MSHPHFEEWIFRTEPLSTEQQQELAAHLEGCPACGRLHAAMGEVEDVLGNSPAARPEPGFVQRWQRELGRDQARRGARQVYAALGSVAVATLGMAILLGLFGWDLVNSPAQVANQLLFNLNLTLNGLRGLPTLVRIGLSLIDGLQVSWALIFTALSGGLGLLWIYLTYRLAWQEVQNGGLA